MQNWKVLQNISIYVKVYLINEVLHFSILKIRYALEQKHSCMVFRPDFILTRFPTEVGTVLLNRVPVALRVIRIFCPW